MGMDLTTGNAKFWLDSVIDLQERRNKIAKELNGVVLSGFSEPKQIHIFSGIDELALVLGKVKIRKKVEFVTDFPEEVYFDYRGYKIFQLMKEETL